MNFFEIIAECAIALAGFGAVHAVLQGSTGPRGVFRAWVVVAVGALSFVLAILPLLLILAPLSNELLWRSASVFGVLGTGVLVATFLTSDYLMSRLGHPPQALLSIRSAQISSILAIIAMIMNFFGWPWPSGPLLYATALVLLMISGLIALLHSFYVPFQSALRGEASASPGDPPAA